MTLLALMLAAVFTYPNPHEIRMQPTGTEPITACGIVRTSGEVLATEPCESGTILTFAVDVAERPGAPDALVRAFAENSAGRTLSVDSGCVDAGQDCERRCGDLHFDYRVTLADFVKLRMAIAASECPPYGDVTGDQLCTLADFILLRRWVAGDRTITLEQDCAGRVGP